ncbi:unnamed protein product [Paramecium pentaurelia]|uniref:Ubiquitin-like domain-containing protein n=1 Tax=Paramecium pentaurelia TaxID=43138 RepID=A0A8S1WQH1_9CILI|nr:unnamed protein product [Paramecium pentaurelia]
MGICTNKQYTQTNDPPQNHRQNRLYQNYQQLASINHPLNVNHKYNNYFQIIPDTTVGKGIKMTNQYTSRLSREEWLEKRKEFWESRVEGEKVYWQSIQKAIEEQDEANALAILNACDLKLVNNSIQLLYDNSMHKYDVPIFMINEPQSFPSTKYCDAGLIQNFQETELKIKVRSNKLPQDFEVLTHTNQSITELKTKVQESAPGSEQCRLFFKGREMRNHHLIGNYQLKDGEMVQAFM